MILLDWIFESDFRTNLLLLLVLTGTGMGAAALIGDESPWKMLTFAYAGAILSARRNR